jgi:predicted homoserine dehydrogenase-like protein
MGMQVQLASLRADLARRAADTGRPIRIGLIGCGEMGTDIVTQCGFMPGLSVVAIADTRLSNPTKAMAIAGRAAGSHAEAASQQALDAIIESGRTAITQDAQLICCSPHVDVVIDATGRPGVGASIGLVAMSHGKHLVMMNVEADVTIGAFILH